ncbi:MAG TPA: hypothetical protein VJX73_08820 [Terracidiphilus sp.]|nr:hypothetical protein [Terracidiphilus sp.]
MIAFLFFAVCSIARAQWEIESSGTAADLRGIDNVGSGVAWASGTNGTVLRTEDGGYLWQACAVPPGAEHLDFRGVQAFDANTAIVMSSGKGDLSRLYKTTDGCQTWKLVFTNPDKDGFWDAVRITSAKTVLMIGDPIPHKELDRFRVKTFYHFPLYGSTDAGETWKRLDTNNLFAMSNTDGGPAQSIFAASNSSLLEIDHHRVIIFVTGGQWVFLGDLEWLDHPNPLICKSACTMSANSKVPLKSGATAGAFSVAVDDADSPKPSLVLVGGDYTVPESRDGTAASCWQDDTVLLATKFECDPAQTPPHGYRSAVTYDAESKTWITVGPNGTDISTDDGKNWRALHPDPAMHEAPDVDRDWNALSLPFVVGPHGRIGKLRAGALSALGK